MMTLADLPKRGRGRPRGVRDHGGRARRVADCELESYAVIIALRLREAREERSVSADELALGAGVSVGQVRRIERGRGRDGRVMNTKLQTLIRIARALNLSPAELLP
jgi:DNA-binding Xre family transcriptional regulator